MRLNTKSDFEFVVGRCEKRQASCRNTQRGQTDAAALDEFRLPNAPKDVSSSLERYALRYLARFGMATKRRLRAKINEKIERLGFEAVDYNDVIDNLVEQLERAGLIDDLEVARLRMRRLRDRGWSLSHIKKDLAARGISPHDMNRLFGADEIERNNDLEWQAALRLAQRRRLGPWRPSDRKISDRTNFKSELRIFAARGFSYAIAKRIINSPTIEELLD